MIELGGNIKLDGFSDVDPSTLIVIKKLVGNYARRVQERVCKFDELVLERRLGSEVTLHARVRGEKDLVAEASDQNLFFAMEKVFSSLMGNKFI